MPTIPYKNAAGQRVSGVTTILNNLGWNRDGLMWWAWNEGMEGRNFRETSGKAADAGTIAHDMIECHIKNRDFVQDGLAPELIDKAETCFLNFLEWEQQVEFVPLFTETHLVSEKYQYGATPDCVALVKSKPCLFDWKTGSGVYPDMLAQLAAYEMAWNETQEPKLEGGFYLLRIGKEDASWHWHYWQSLPEAWEVFLHALELHKLHKILKKKT